MFSLLITVIAIALVVVLAMVAVYYGGESSKKATARATATTLINQATQIEAAGAVAVSQGAGWPAHVPNFLPPFLQSMPVPPKGAYTHDVPTATDWEYYVPAPSTRHFALKEKVSRDVCMAINEQFGMIGIPAMWTGKDLVQCFGPGVKTGADDKLSYTFFYDPRGASAAEEAAALAQSLKEAVDAGVTSPTPGYPRLCPNNTVITSGVCTGASGDSTSGPTEPDEEGYFIVSATTGNFKPALVSEGFSATCPVGAIDPTGPSATPVVTDPREPFNADGVMRTGWMIQPDWNAIYDTYLTRTWCFPALKSEVFPAGPLAHDVAADVTDVTLTPAVPNADPMDYTWATSASTSFVAKGQFWTVMAVSFEADLWNYDNGDNPWMVGDKLAVGRGNNLSVSYYGGVPALSYNGTTYAGEQGTIMFRPTPPVSPRKLEVSWPGGAGTTVPFPDTAVTLASPPLPITFRNISSRPVPVDAVPEVYGPFAIESNTCTNSIAVGASCVISVIFVPTVEGPQSGGISVDIGGQPATPSFQGSATPEPRPGYWLIQGKTAWSDAFLKTLGFETACPPGGVDPTSPSAQPIQGLPAGEMLNADGLLKQQWVPYSQTPDYSGTQRVWCIPAMSTDVRPLAKYHTDYEERNFPGQNQYTITPNASQWYWTNSGANIATVTIRAKEVVWTLAAITSRFHGSNDNFTPAGMQYLVEKLAIGRTSSFTGSYYAGGPTGRDKNGITYSHAGFVRYGDADPAVSVEFVFHSMSTYVNNINVGETGHASSIAFKNMTSDTVEIIGQGIVGGSSSPFKGTMHCGKYVAPGEMCLVGVTYTAAQTGRVYDQFAIQTQSKTYIVDLMGETK